MKLLGEPAELGLPENLDAGEVFDTDESKVGFVWIDSVENGLAVRDRKQLLGINERSDDPFSTKFARPSGNHSGGINVAYCDASTQFMNEKIDYQAFVLFMTPASNGLKKAGSTEPVSKVYQGN